MHSMAVALSAGSKANMGTNQSEKAESRDAVKSQFSPGESSHHKIKQITSHHHRIITIILSILDHHHHIIITSSSHPENHVTIKSSLNQQLMIQLSPNHHNNMIISFSCIHNFTFRLSWVPLIFLSEDIIERPGLQLCDVPQLASLAEILL